VRFATAAIILLAAILPAHAAASSPAANPADYGVTGAALVAIAAAGRRKRINLR